MTDSDACVDGDEDALDVAGEEWQSVATDDNGGEACDGNIDGISVFAE